MSVCEIEPDRYEEFASKQNRFYLHYNLYPPGDASSIANARDVSVEGRKPYRFFSVMDSKGNLLAGARTWARGLLKSDTINLPPAQLSEFNQESHGPPSGFVLRDIAVSGLWYEDHQVLAARTLWEAIRWECREQGTVTVANFDPRDPAREVVTADPWHQAGPKISMAIHSPVPRNRENLLFPLGRV
jgi:hypothetical protein